MWEKYKRFGSHRSFTEDVVLAIKTVDNEEAPNLVQKVRGCLIYTTLRSMATKVTPEMLAGLAQGGQVPQALGFAALIKDLVKQSKAYRLIGMVLLASKEVKEACIVLGQALQAAQAIKEEWAKGQALREVAPALAQAGLVDQALQAAQAIKEEWAKAMALSEVAQALIQVAEKEHARAVAIQALQAAQAIKEEWEKGEALSYVAQTLARAGLVDQALQAAQAIKEEGDKANALSEVAQTLAQTGLVDQALQAIQVLEDEGAQGEALLKVVQAMIQEGQQEQTMRMLQNAFTLARLVEREAIFRMLKQIATSLSIIDQGQTLWCVYKAIVEVESWWSVSEDRSEERNIEL
jgi:hypothetical protein